MSSSGTSQTTAPTSSGVAGEHIAHQEPAVGAAVDGQLRRRRHAPPDEGAGHGGEVLVNPVAVLPQARPVPVGPVLPAAADIGHHEDAAALEPGLADDRQVVDSQGHLEAAVAVEHGGRRTSNASPAPRPSGT